MSAAYGNEPREARAFKASQRGDHAKRFRDAARHSRRVKLLRVGLPVATLVFCLLLALIAFFNPLRMLSNLPISVDGVVVSGTKINMENPKLSGFTKDKRRYDVNAGAAAQDLKRPGIIELHTVNATLEMQDKNTMHMVADEGLYDTKKEELTLEKNIVIKSTNGQEAYLEEATIDTKKGNVVSERPVRMKTENGTVRSNRFEMQNSGEVVLFKDGVVVNLLKMDNSATPAQTNAAQKP